MRVIGIPARYGSKRLPGKPLREIGGKPIIKWVVERALEVEGVRVIVVTDDERIKMVVKDLCEVIMTPSEIPSGTDRLAYALKNLKDEDLVVNLQGDEPFIDPNIVNRLFDVMENEDADIYTLAKWEDMDENPNRVKVVVNSKGYALYFSRCSIPYSSKLALVHIGIYGYRKSKLIEFSNLQRSELESVENLEQLRALYWGWKIKVEVVEYKGISIDTEEDLERAKGFYLKGC